MILRAKPSHCFRNLVVNTLDQPWLGACCPLIVDLQSVAVSRHCCPDISVSQSLAHLPTPSQESDLARAIDPPDEVNPSGRNGQLFRYLLDLRAGQSLLTRSSAGLSGCQAGERWWIILTHVPGEELPALSQDFIEGAESEPRPETLCPQLVDAFDQGVALGLCRRDEDQLDAEVETETDKGAKAARSLISTSGGGVVVESEIVRQPQCLPGL